MIEIRRCHAEEKSDLMDFIGRYWLPGHVLAVSSELLDWQHRAADGTYNYLLAVRDHEIQAVLGYIPSRRFDATAQADDFVWLALWKIRPDCRVSGLGLRMLNELARLHPGGIGVNGINPAHVPMYRALGYHTGALNQHYLVNPKAPRSLLGVPDDLAFPAVVDKGGGLSELGRAKLESLSSAEFATAGVIPRKTPRYFVSRFLDHPFYDYTIYLARAAGCGPALIATRFAEHGPARALRIVDFAGDPSSLAACGGALLRILEQSGAQYADLLHSGLLTEALDGAGFALLQPTGSIAVPNHFEPFIAENRRILFAIRVPGNFLVCRADGDQDRPNQVRSR
jgi:hypothetical protein